MKQPISREDFPALFTSLGFTGWGAEIGTYEGQYARQLLEGWGGRLHCVDPFIHQPGWRDILNHSTPGFEVIKQRCKENLTPWLRNGRCILHECFSEDAVKFWWAHDLDFVYLDARHDYASVLDDIHRWWPTIVPGGILAGHDYLNGAVGETLFEVKRAVQDWASGVGLPVNVTQENQYKSWWVRKPDAEAA